MKLIQLGGANDALCHFLSFGEYEMLLDCGVRVSMPTATTEPLAAIPSSGPATSSSRGIRIELPALNAIDVRSLDVLLLSNHQSMLALPFLTEYLGFKGVVYATEMTLRFGRLLMKQLASSLQDDGLDASNTQVEFMTRSSGQALTNTATAPTLSMFTLEDIARSCAVVQCAEYKEIVPLSYGVHLTPLSSGFSLGACLWLLNAPNESFAYVPAASGDLNRHPKELDFAPLIECDTLFLTDIKPERDPHATTERTVEHVLAAVSRVLDRGGVCIIPASPCGVLFDLVEAVYAACMHNKSVPTQPQTQTQTQPPPQTTSSPWPMYCLSPFVEEAIDLTQCGAEWLCEKKIGKLYAGEPAFLQETLLKNKLLHIASELSTSVITGLQRGGVVFAGHESLRFGVGPELLQLYGHDNRNAVLLIDPNMDPAIVLSPFYALEIEKMVCPIDARLSCGDVNQFIARCCPRTLVAPHDYLIAPSAATNQHDIKADLSQRADAPPPASMESSHFSRVFPLHELTAGKPKTELATLSMHPLTPISLEKTAKYIDGTLDLDLAACTNMTDVNGKAAATISGVITVRGGNLTIESATTAARRQKSRSSVEPRLVPGTSVITPLNQKQDASNGDNSIRLTGGKRKEPPVSSSLSASGSTPSSISPTGSAMRGYAIPYREQSSILLGSVDEDQLLAQLKAHDPHLAVYVSQGPDNADAMLSIPSMDARITLWKESARTRVETPSEATRNLLLPMLLAHLHVLPTDGH